MVGLTVALLGGVQAGELLELHQQQNDGQLKSEPAVSAAKGEVTRIGLERLRCFAGCQGYTFIVEPDGRFTYEGRYDVERMGRHTGQVSEGYLLQIIKFMEDMNFMALNTSYADQFLDGPSVYTMVEKGGEIHVVENYANNGPGSLWALEQLMDKLLETAEWDAVDQSR